MTVSAEPLKPVALNERETYLLEALVRVVDELDWSLLLESDDLPERQQAHAALLQAAESAIAKAKGERP